MGDFIGITRYFHDLGYIDWPREPTQTGRWKAKSFLYPLPVAADSSPGIHANQWHLANSKRNRSWMTVIGYLPIPSIPS